MICFSCKENKPLGFYTKMASGRPRKRCKSCIAAEARAAYRSNPSPRKQSAKRWRDKNPPAYQIRRELGWQRRRALKLNAFVEDVKRATVYEMHGGMCGICEEFIVGEFHVDHVVPLSRGGLHSYSNTQPAHPFCNRSKGVTIGG
jgi:5-methylcytosine-specific restriction endonuclease McrA